MDDQTSRLGEPGRYSATAVNVMTFLGRTSSSETVMNPYDTPTKIGERKLRSPLFFGLFIGCVAMSLLSVVVSGHAVMRILETTPAMGIPVDAQGNRIPIQGYPQLGFGLACVVLFAVPAIALKMVGRHT